MTKSSPQIRRWTGYGVFALAGLICVAVIAFLTVSVTKDLRLLKSANSDNVQWSLSQAEVEFLDFETQVADAIAKPEADLTALRREFDIFFSRIATLGSGSVFSNLREFRSFKTALTQIRGFLDRTVGFIDSDDIGLRAALPQLLTEAQAVRAQVRKLSNSGLSFFAQEADERRAEISNTLIRLAFIVIALILTLLAFALYLSRLNTLNLRRGRETMLTSVRMNTIMSTSLDAVIVTDANGAILEFNKAAEAMFGRQVGDVRGKSIGDVIVPDHFRQAHEAGMERMRQNGEKRVVGKGRVKLEAIRQNGEVFPVELAIQTADTDDGDIFIAFLRDISKQVGDENELIEARDKALAGEKAKSDFLAVMSHEIRTPLNGLLGNLELLQDTKVSEPQTNLIRHMETSGRLLMSHVTDVLDISRYDAGKFELHPKPLNLNDFLQELTDNQSARAVEQQTDLGWQWVGPPVNWVNTDRNVMQAILLNLIGNAVKFTQNGTVRVEAETLSIEDAVTMIEFRVSDTGIGIEESALAKVFDDFSTGNVNYNRLVGGTGLGLGIAKRFATALGGKIGCESTFGAGSLFWVRLPLEVIAAPGHAVSDKTDRATALPQNILVVEDNEINRQVVGEMLKAQGHRVTEATDGLSGVERANGEKFDLILMDISMPVMDGRAATRAIRAGNGASAHVPIVALTANAMAEERAAFLDDGMNDVLSKPLTRRALSALIQSVAAPAPEAVGDAGLFVDLAQLAEVQDALGDVLFRKNLDKFGAEVGEFLTWFAQADPQESDDIGARAHKVAGAAAMFGAQPLLGALKQLETQTKTGQQVDIPLTQQTLTAIWQQTETALDSAA